MTILWNSNSQQNFNPGSVVAMASGTTLLPGDPEVFTVSGDFGLNFEPNGKLTLRSYSGGFPVAVLWESDTLDLGATILAMQADGNLVIYAGPVVLWATGTGPGNEGAYLRLLENGDLQVYTPGVVPIPPPFFPEAPSQHGFSIHKRPTFASTVLSPTSGREVTGFQAPYPLWEFELTYEQLKDETQNSNKVPFASVSGFAELQRVLSLYLVCNGQYKGFLYNDPDDNSRANQAVAVADGTTTRFVVPRVWGSGSYALIEPVGAINVMVAVYFDTGGGPVLQDPLLYYISGNALVFYSAPANGTTISATFTFYYFCRFIEDSLELSQFMQGRWGLASLRFRSTSIDTFDSAAPPPGPIPISFVKTEVPSFSGTPSTGTYVAVGGPYGALVFGFLIATNDVTAVTYDGEAMTSVGVMGAVAGNFIYMYYLLGPTSGAGNFVVTSTAGSGVQYPGVCEYIGVRPTGQPDDTSTQGTPVVPDFTQFCGSDEDNGWIITYVNGTTVGGYEAGANLTMRQAMTHGAMGDSGPRTPPGLHSFTVHNDDTGTNWTGISIMFAPSA